MSDQSGDEGYFIPQEKLYACVELEHEGETFATPVVTQWLFNKKLGYKHGKIIKRADCHWPPEKSLSNALEKRSTPKDNWSTKNCIILCTNRTLAGAKKSSSEALHNSEVSESGAETSTLPSKRTRNNPARFSPSPPQPKKARIFQRGGKITDDDSGDSDCGQTLDDIAETLRINKEHKNLAPAKQSSMESEMQITPSLAKNGKEKKGDKDVEEIDPADVIEEINEKSANATDPPAGDVEVIDKPQKTAGSERAVKEAADINPIVSNAASTPPTTPTKSTSGGPRKECSFATRKSHSPYKSCFTPSKRSPKFVAGEPVSHSTFVREMNTLSGKLNGLQIMVKKIYRSTCPVLNLNAGEETEDDLPNFPLTTQADLTKFETYIQNSDNKVTVIRYFVEHGKNTTNDSVKAMMPRLFTNALASEFNMDGINRSNCEKQKKGFKDSPAHTIILAALKKRAKDLDKTGSIHGYNVQDINTYISLWLKNAPKRHATELKREEKKKSVTSENNSDDKED